MAEIDLGLKTQDGTTIICFSTSDLQRHLNLQGKIPGIDIDIVPQLERERIYGPNDLFRILQALQREGVDKHKWLFDDSGMPINLNEPFQITVPSGLTIESKGVRETQGSTFSNTQTLYWPLDTLDLP